MHAYFVHAPVDSFVLNKILVADINVAHMRRFCLFRTCL